MTAVATPLDARAVRRRALLVAAVALLAYANAVPSGYAFDDRMVVLENPVVQGREPALNVFVRDWWGHPARRTVGSYRPLPELSLALEWRAFGHAPWVSHLVNVLLHAAVMAAVYLAWRPLAAEAVALLAALFAAVLCAPSESVQGIVGRADLVESLGLLAALFFHRRGGARSAALATAGLAVALLSKETALFAPAALVALDLVVPAAVPWRARLGRYAAYAAATAGYLGLRVVATGALFIRATEPLYNPLIAEGPVGRVFGAGRIFLERYVQGWVVPWRRLYDCSAQACTASTPSDPVAWAGIALFAACLAAPLVLWRRAPVAAAGLAWFAVFFAPISNFPLKATLTYGERLLYVPSMGLAVALAAGSAWLAGRLARPVVAWAPMAAFAAVNLVALQARHLDWRSDAALAASGLRYGAKSVVVQQNNATAAVERGDLVAAEGFARAAVGLVPDDAYAHKILGLALTLQGRRAEAEDEFRRAVSLGRGRYGDIVADWAGFLARQQRYGEALEAVRAQLLREPADPRLQELARRLAERVRMSPAGAPAPAGP